MYIWNIWTNINSQHTTIIVFYMELCGTTINFYVWGTHLPKIDNHGENVLVFHVLRIYAGKNRKTKNVGTCGTRSPTFLHFSFFEIFFSKFVKREKLAHFWHGYLFLRVNEWLGQWWLLLIFIPYSLTLSLTLSSALSKVIDINLSLLVLSNNIMLLNTQSKE